MSASNTQERLIELKELAAGLEEAFRVNDPEGIYECLEQIGDVLFDLQADADQLDENLAEDDV